LRPSGGSVIVIRRAGLGCGSTTHERPRSKASGALRETKVAYIITEPCIGTKDASCVEVCPVDCIYEGGDQYYIHPDECIDCGACEPECPVQAIFPDTDVPPEWTSYIEKNKVHFD
jgi:ferredoxin